MIKPSSEGFFFAQTISNINATIRLSGLFLPAHLENYVLSSSNRLYQKCY